MPTESKIANRNFTVIRATPNQTAILRACYTHSDVPSQQQLVELSEQTGLPQKWIHQWFVRQRSKDRRANPNPDLKPEAVSTQSGSPSTHVQGTRSSSAYSHDSIMQIKTERGDPGAFLSSSGTPSSSEYLGTVSASSSLVMGQHCDLSAAPAPVLQTTKKTRKRAGPQKEKVSPSSTRALRSRTKKEPNVQNTLVKKEIVEEALLENLSVPQVPTSKCTGSPRKPAGAGPSQVKIGRTPARPPASAYPFLPMISPAKRSPITIGSNLQQGTSALKTHSRLSIDQTDSIFANSSRVQHQIQRDGVQTLDSFISPSGTQRIHTTMSPQHHYDKPVFHTRFQNNGPADFVNNNIRDSMTSKVDFSPTLSRVLSHGEGVQDIPRPAPFPLAPAFDWCNHVPSTSTTREPGGGVTTVSSNLPKENKPLQFRFTEPNRNPVGAAFDRLITELDPSLAPQKYLLDFLKNRTNENGTYTVDQGLIDALVGDSPPFYKAMGLSFLSKLGLEWAQQ